MISYGHEIEEDDDQEEGVFSEEEEGRETAAGARSPEGTRTTDEVLLECR